jgi:protein phosphatase PTC1
VTGNFIENSLTIFDSRGGKAVRLTKDHKATDKSEQERVKKSGGAVFGGKIGGFLAVSRSFGDFEVKQYGVIVEPYVKIQELGPHDTHLILACDGVSQTV